MPFWEFETVLHQRLSRFQTKLRFYTANWFLLWAETRSGPTNFVVVDFYRWAVGLRCEAPITSKCL
jgi:hypothetical protein